MPNDSSPAIDSPIARDKYAEHVQRKIALAAECPFDGRSPTDAAHRTAQAIFADLNGRRGIGLALNDVDADVKVEIIDIVAAIVREVMTPAVLSVNQS